MIATLDCDNRQLVASISALKEQYALLHLQLDYMSHQTVAQHQVGWLSLCRRWGEGYWNMHVCLSVCLYSKLMTNMIALKKQYTALHSSHHMITGSSTTSVNWLIKQRSATH